MKNRLNSISAFQIYQLLKYATLIVIGIILTKTAISTSEIGEYEAFSMIAGAVSFFWLNGLQKALLSQVDQKKYEKSGIFSSFVIVQFLSITAAAFLFFLQPFFSKILLNGSEIPAFGVLLLYIVFGVPANQVEYYYLIRKKNRRLVSYGILSSIIQMVMTALPAFLNMGITAVLMGLVVSAVLRYLWMWLLFIMNNELKLSGSFIKENLVLGGPLVLAALLSGSAQYIDGFIVTSYFDEETFAVFRYGARELPLALLLANALSNAMIPDFASKEMIDKNLATLKASVSRLMHFLFPLTAILLLISHPVFPIIFNPGFAESATIFNIYLLLVISRLILPQTLLNGMQLTKPILNAAILELVLNVSLSLLFVQFWGIAGVAYGTFIAFLFEKIYLFVIVKKSLNVPVSSYLALKPFIIYSVSTLALFILVEWYFVIRL